MQLTLLGTSCSIPTKDRNTAGYFLSYKNHGILFDCGEGTQRQMKICGIKLSRLTKILITHWHGDHVLGLGGLLQSIGQLDSVDTLELYGPKGSKTYLDHLFKSLAFELRVPLKIIEVDEGTIFQNDDFSLETLPLRHRTVCQAYAFVERDKRRIQVQKLKKLDIPEGPLVGKLQRGESLVVNDTTITPDMVSSLSIGRKFAYITDTLLTENCYAIARNADILLCECVYDEKFHDKARAHKHLTAKEAGLIASRSGVKKLIISHFSARYKDTAVLEADARTVFDNVLAGKDFMKVTL